MNKYNLIFLEGTDKSGKSTTANFLLKKIKNSVLIHANIRPFNNSEEERNKIRNYYKELIKLANNKFFKDKTIIVDRFFPSQIVYSIKRGFDEFNSRYYKQFENTVLKNKHLLIYVRPLEETIVRRYKKEGDEYINENDIKILVERYDKFFEQTKLNKIQITSSDDERLKQIW